MVGLVLRNFGLCLLLTMVTSVGCRGQEKVAEVPQPNKKGAKPSKGEAPEVGPKIMGYEYFFRYSYSLLNAKYNDTQSNASAESDSSLSDVKLDGARHTLEHYPVVYSNFPRSQYGYALFEYRSETPDQTFWTKHQTVLALMGYVLPRWRMVAAVVGLHAEFNQVDMGLPEAPEVVKSDLRALVVGANFRQKIWGTGSWFAAYYTGRLHALNLGLTNPGFEAELGLGTSYQFGFLRFDTTLGYIEQRHRAEGAAKDAESVPLKISSRYQSTYLAVSLWI